MEITGICYFFIDLVLNLDISILCIPSFVNIVFTEFRVFQENGGIMDKMIGVRIKERRKALKLSGAQIKQQTGISTGNLSDIENGKSLPSAIALIELSKALNCSTDYILFGISRSSELPEFSELRENDSQLLKQFHSLPEDDQEEILMMIQLKYNRVKKSESNLSSSPEDDNAINIA